MSLNQNPHQDPNQDPLARYGKPLAALLIAVVLSVLIAALLGGLMPFDYNGRAGVYAALVVYLVIGAVLVFRRAAQGEGQMQDAFSLARISRWTVSLWIWPLLIFWRR